MNRTFQLEPPLNRGPVQVYGVMMAAMHALGFDLGNRIDACMTGKAGAGWLEDLRLRRLADTGYAKYRGRLNVRDPSFVVAEVLDDSSSPMRECLPRTQRLYDSMSRMRNVRNKWQHFNHLPDLRVLETDLGAVRDVAACADLAPLVADIDRVLAVLPDLARHSGPPTEDLRKVIEQERLKAAEQAKLAARLRREMQELLDRVRGASQQGRQIADLEAQLDELVGRVSAAESERDLAQAQYAQAQAEMTRRQAEELASSAVDYSGLEVGDPWPGAPGERVVRLMSSVCDLYDPARQTLLSEEYGEVAVSAARRWLEQMPHGGTVHLTPDGYGCRVRNGQWVYTGQLSSGE